MRLATAYDLVNTAIFLPAGGSRRLRRSFVRHLGVKPSERVLELGCGTGQVTAELIATGASARVRAPAATFVDGDIAAGAPEGPFDVGVLSFVLHSFDGPGRVKLLHSTAGSLAPGGRIGILDWSSPTSKLRARLWRRFLHRLEPSPNVDDLLDGALPADVAAAGLVARTTMLLAGRRVQLLVVTPPS
jgi:ubiquinone/menaquinone biosynthesis C-methylase UbiE